MIEVPEVTAATAAAAGGGGVELGVGRRYGPGPGLLRPHAEAFPRSAMPVWEPRPVY